MEIANKRKINIITVSAGDKLIFDRSAYMEILYPSKKLDHEDINNNSIVSRFVCKGKKILFTRRYRGNCRKEYFEII